ncbi:hypothetical protein B296_00002941 [Ensete ventricosum]|uniref:Uncharacterized protein n=1 Tax=Ensete ventricosum TaxID=4639 RepID=A0A426XFZ7_ENSVE|nr:hypothetical protein B296_00002941 [Ensete ventricosum]
MMRWDLAGSSLGDSPKGSGSSLGTQREITGKKSGGLAGRMPEAEEKDLKHEEENTEEDLPPTDCMGASTLVGLDLTGGTLRCRERSCSEEQASRVGIQRNANPLRKRHHEDKQAKKNA